MMTLVVHISRSHFDVRIDRPSKWGNKWTHLPRVARPGIELVSTREVAIRHYETWLRNSPEMIAELHTLRGKALGCWCRPEACHGDVLVKLIGELCVDCDKVLRDIRYGSGYRCLPCYQDATVPSVTDG